MSYYNTTNETAEVLRQNKIRANSQAVKIIAWFEDVTTIKPDYKGSPSGVHKAVFSMSKTPLTSIRRAMNDLTRIGLLRKTSIKRMGRFGRLEFCWKLNTATKENHNDR